MGHFFQIGDMVEIYSQSHNLYGKIGSVLETKNWKLSGQMKQDIKIRINGMDIWTPSEDCLIY
ncbi:hypothetical protein [Paenibacillus sp. NAIST15-1]|uniref:hypothetical protein n=1 Tax=Paenibacillus sp. NAIST15-1 TaxID=1605994 RepID=UPI00086B08F0|nr:hypothetical protein [Paenibacillus sp. NAIST15-1]GAV11469.1 hypothetical protein PBN151_1398 [Paenibacillus sp. NAIST15-1]